MCQSKDSSGPSSSMLGTREVFKDLIQTLHKDMVGVMGRLDKIISLLDSAERDKPRQEKQEIDACDTPEREVYIGDPRASKLAVTRATMKGGRRSLLALNLVDILFDQDSLRRSTVCGSRDSPKEALDPRKIEAIRSHCFQEFPIHEEETGKEALQKMTKAVTDKCLLVAKSYKAN
ncbi:uncharacterized protein LOC134186861 isoform X2 [Corticium candelabrum]|uniref:uncharacterized protein LOC134186861 isoform X2 n=1 Tax=Corticium candelabrum TaxID=121492 RepID=UPI002E25B83D|nr:uncharacterized protein LOC134186861 isoform X2 [Corticium candelabrum]